MQLFKSFDHTYLLVSIKLHLRQLIPWFFFFFFPHSMGTIYGTLFRVLYICHTGSQHNCKPLCIQDYLSHWIVRGGGASNGNSRIRMTSIMLFFKQKRDFLLCRAMSHDDINACAHTQTYMHTQDYNSKVFCINKLCIHKYRPNSKTHEIKLECLA